MNADPQVRLRNQHWLEADATRRVIGLLNAHTPDCAMFVGGCVRNALLGAPVDDIDIATQLEPDTVISVLEAAGVAVHKTGYEHGTVTAVADGAPFEITTLRRDVETDGRRAVIAFTRDWAEDAQRRDFRLNALYAAADGRIFDPVGQGLEDIRTRKIVFIGDADQRIREDYLRILRFFRFNAWYGRGESDADGLEACQRLKSGLEQVSAERIWMELKKLLSASDPRRAMQAMWDGGVLQVMLPDVWGLSLFDALVANELAAGLERDPLVRLMALFSRDEALLARVAERLRMSNAEKKRMTLAAHDDAPLSPAMDRSQINQALYLMGRQVFRDRVRLAWAARPDSAAFADWLALFEAADAWQRPQFPITGEDVIAVGVTPGPDVGEVLRRVEAWWVVNDFPADVESLARRMRDVADETSS